MIGLLLWQPPDLRRPALESGEESILQMRFFCVRLRRERPAALRRHVKAAAKRLRRAGVTRVVLPTGFPCGELLQKYGIFPVSTLSLRRSLAADLVRAIQPCDRARVAVAGERVTEELVRAVTEISLRSRYVLVSLPYGGEELCRRLRRAYGVSPLLNPSREQLDQADVLVLFSRREDLKNPAVVPLYEGAEDAPLPPLTLPPEWEAQLPPDCHRPQLLAALLEGGALRREQITLGAESRTGLDIPEPSPYNTTL
ncbi:MAG: hypothetical protein RR035_00705 [Oscillibacter sp.]